MFDREIKLIGKDNLNKIQSKTILLIGLGGVGGYSLETLIRAGIKNIIIVDYDIIDITNLNRQILTNTKNISKYKTEVAKNRILDINPNCNITIINEKITKDNINILFNNKIDYIIDACDSIEVKKELIIQSIKRKIKLITCCGTGNKLDPTKFYITDIRKTSYDPIAKILRKFVIDNKIKDKVIVVSSTEQPKKIEGKISSISYVPSIAGILLTSYVINDIIIDKN